ncbi:MAG: hypothetical protein R3F29_07260 [Planctomycetota bacterium]
MPQPTTWPELQERARLALRCGLSPERRRGWQVTRVLQFVRLPSFEGSTSYGMYRCRSEDRVEFHGTRLHWQFEIDCAKFGDPVERLRHASVLEPTLEQRCAELPFEPASALVADLEAVAIPVVARSPSFGLDGTGFELAFGELRNAVKIDWWMQPPENWREACSLGERLAAMVDGVVGARW